MTNIVSFWFQTEQQSSLQALAERQSFLLSKPWKGPRVCQSFHTPSSGVLFSCQPDSFGRQLCHLWDSRICVAMRQMERFRELLNRKMSWQSTLKSSPVWAAINKSLWNYSLLSLQHMTCDCQWGWWKEQIIIWMDIFTNRHLDSVCKCVCHSLLLFYIFYILL